MGQPWPGTKPLTMLAARSDPNEDQNFGNRFFAAWIHRRAQSTESRSGFFVGIDSKTRSSKPSRSWKAYRQPLQ